MPDVTAVTLTDASTITFDGTGFQQPSLSSFTAQVTFNGVKADTVTVDSDI
jgi:hypothetical protein